MAVKLSNKEIAEGAADIEILAKKILAAMNIEEYQISRPITRHVYFHFMRDMDKLFGNQEHGVVGTKYIGYLAFWLRKLKPISFAYKTADDKAKERNEIIYINETVAVEMAASLLIANGRHRMGNTRGACGSSACDGHNCVSRYITNLLIHSDARFHKYLVYSMAHRTFGPHHLCSILDGIEFGACSYLRDGLRTS
jgi:hypothetical protein